MKSSIPKNCCGALYAPVTWPPFTFSHPLVAQCWASMYMFPFQSHTGPQQKVQCAVEEICLPGEPPWGTALSSREAPIHFRPQFTARFEFSPDDMPAQGCCFFYRRWRGRPFWWASQCSACCHPPSRSLLRDLGCYLSVHVQIVVCQIPPMSYCASGSQNKVISGCGAACWPCTCLLQLLTVYWLQGQIKTDGRVYWTMFFLWRHLSKPGTFNLYHF
jgi:hypothetical protein